VAKPWKPPEEPKNEDDSPVPVEPRGADLTRRRRNIDHAREMMQPTADEISRLLQSEQQRQEKYRKDKLK
jgi:hypothetical protein